MLNDIGPRVSDEFKPMVTMQLDRSVTREITTPTETYKCNLINVTLKPEFTDYNLDTVLSFYLPAQYLETYMQQDIMPLYKKINKITIMGYYILQGLGFAYILNISIKLITI